VVRHRKAFTAIELLIAISIIAILVGMLLLGLKHMVGSATGSSSQIGLQNARSMLADLETRDSLTTQLGPIYPTYSTAPIAAPEMVTVEAYDSSSMIPQNNGRFLSPAVVSTQLVMAKLRSVPANRELLSKMAAERLLRPQAGGLPYGSNPVVAGKPIMVSDLPLGSAAVQDHGHPDPPILVDAWNNPIIFVPPAGLTVAFAWTAGKTYAVGQAVGDGSGKYYRCIKTPDAGTPVTDATFWEAMPPSFNATNGVVTSPDRRPFFASAGPDGNFQSPMDNLYSFEQ
jgi:prepilin-type N-terminal cleavage/methylation domain-containing protein